MGKYLVRQVIYSEADVKEEELMPMKEAATALALTLPGLVRAIERGQLTEYIDSSRQGARKGRRYVLRKEVEEWQNRREEQAIKLE
jgi:hypothetical protein